VKAPSSSAGPALKRGHATPSPSPPTTSVSARGDRSSSSAQVHSTPSPVVSPATNAVTREPAHSVASRGLLTTGVSSGGNATPSGVQARSASSLPESPPSLSVAVEETHSAVQSNEVWLRPEYGVHMLIKPLALRHRLESSAVSNERSIVDCQPGPSRYYSRAGHTSFT
jgi:hypothetical protein